MRKICAKASDAISRVIWKWYDGLVGEDSDASVRESFEWRRTYMKLRGWRQRFTLRGSPRSYVVGEGLASSGARLNFGQ